MISYALIVLAAFFNACMDCFENSPNFYESIFSHWNRNFWCKDISWQFAKKIGSYKLDSWHISKSLMIICWALAVVTMTIDHWWGIKLLSIGILWNVSFWLFYHKLFKVK